MTKASQLRAALGQLLGKNSDPDKAARAAARAARAQDRAAKDQRRQTKKSLRASRLAASRQHLLAAGGDDVSIVAVDYHKADVFLVATSEMERKWRARACAKEPWTIAWLEQSLSAGGVLYDIGANVGTFSLIAAKIAGAHGTAIAFEPAYGSFAHLCDNIVLNRCQDSVIPVPLAVGRETGLATLQYKTLAPGQSRHGFKEGTWKREAAFHSSRYRQPVFTMSLDKIVRQFRLPPPNHMKLDVDGNELNVLRGARTTLAAPELQSILIEIDDSLTEPVTALLNDAGFELAEKNKRVHQEATQVWYGIFRRRA